MWDPLTTGVRETRAHAQRGEASRARSRRSPLYLLAMLGLAAATPSWAAPCVGDDAPIFFDGACRSVDYFEDTFAEPVGFVLRVEGSRDDDPENHAVITQILPHGAVVTTVTDGPGIPVGPRIAGFALESRHRYVQLTGPAGEDVDRVETGSAETGVWTESVTETTWTDDDNATRCVDGSCSPLYAPGEGTHEARVADMGHKTNEAMKDQEADAIGADPDATTVDAVDGATVTGTTGDEPLASMAALFWIFFGSELGSCDSIEILDYASSVISCLGIECTCYASTSTYRVEYDPITCEVISTTLLYVTVNYEEEC